MKKKRPTEAVEVEPAAFELTPEEEAELAEAIRDIEQGHFVTAEALLARLRR